MEAMPLTREERAVIDELGDDLGAGRERALPARLDSALHRLEERGCVALLSRGAEIGGEREYSLCLTPHGRLALDAAKRAA